MAGALARLGGLRVLEDAVQLLRRTPLSAFAWHAAGSVPFASAVVLFLIQAADSRPSDSQLAVGALVTAVTLAWMNCCRAVFAGYLLCQLNGRMMKPWTWGAVWRLAVSQTVLGATKLAALPVAVCSIFPLGFAVSFFRSAAALAVNADLDLFALCARAARVARFRPRRNWVVVALLALFFPLAFGNVALVLALLPQMVRILTGYESVFSRSGVYFVMNPVFLWSALACTWLVFDPLIQAAYCVSSFEADSQETGEDLRVAMRRIRSAATGAAAAVLLVAAGLTLTPAPLHANTSVSTSDLAHAVRMSAQAPEYDWSRLPPPRPDPGEPWIVRVTKRGWEACQSAIEAIGDAVRQVFRWLFENKKLPEPAKRRALSKGLVPLGVYLLIALTLVAAGLVAWRLRVARESSAAVSGPPLNASGTPAPRPDEVNPLALPEQEWFGLADGYLREEQWRLAVRALYLASLAWLGGRQYLSIHLGKTNRQYERELGRRTGDVPIVRKLFAANVRIFESAWYGMHELEAADAIRFRNAVDEIVARLEGAA